MFKHRDNQDEGPDEDEWHPVTDEDERYEEKLAQRARRIGDYDFDPVIEELAAYERAVDRREAQRQRWRQEDLRQQQED